MAGIRMGDKSEPLDFNAYYECPMCGRVVIGARYLLGYDKCIDCCNLVKTLRNDHDVFVSCLGLFYGRTYPVEHWVNRRRLR